MIVANDHISVNSPALNVLSLGRESTEKLAVLST